MAPRTWLLAIPMVGAVFAYGRALHGDFVFDDLSNVVHDPAVRSLAASTRAGVLLPSLLAAGHSGGRGFTAWTFALNRAIGGSDPFGYHLGNLALHLLVTLLVFFFARALFRRAVAANSAGCALAVAGVFALHPLHSQAVNYITQRSEVIASAAYLGSLLILMRASTARWLGAMLLLLAAVVLFALGLGAKAIIVTMPATYWLLVLVLPDSRPGALRPRLVRHLALTAPFFFLAAWKASALLNSVEGHADAGFSVTVGGLTPWTYFMTQWKVILIYIRLLFWPSGLCLHWHYPVSTRLTGSVIAAGATLLAMVTVAAIVTWRVRRLPKAASVVSRLCAFGLFWFLLVLAPTSSFLPIADALFEHRTYLASVGLLVAMVTLAERGLARLPSRVAVVSVAVVWICLGTALYRRNRVWESPVSLWSDVVAKRPPNLGVYATLAMAYQARGDLVSAIREYGLALRASPDSPPEHRAWVLGGMAAAIADAGRPLEATAVARAALDLKPGDPRALATLAAAALRAGNLDEAERSAQAVLATNPDHSQALLTLGEIRLSRGDAAGATPYLARSVEIEPDEPARLLEYGQALAKLGRNQEACPTWQGALRSLGANHDDRDRATHLSAELGCGVTGPP